MNTQLIITFICDDQPGVVERLAQVVSDNQGNWLESRMAQLAQLAGKFAGILQIAVEDSHLCTLKSALVDLNDKGYNLVIQEGTSAQSLDSRAFNFTVVGPDRIGIVKEITQAFASRHINMTELETACSSTPWSGEPLFEAAGVILVPKSVNMNELYDDLDTIGNDLAIDVRLESSTENLLLNE